MAFKMAGMSFGNGTSPNKKKGDLKRGITEITDDFGGTHRVSKSGKLVGGSFGYSPESKKFRKDYSAKYSTPKTPVKPKTTKPSSTASSFYGKKGIQREESKQQFKSRKRVEKVYAGQKNKTSYQDVAKKLQKGDAFKAGKTKDITSTIIKSGKPITKKEYKGLSAVGKRTNVAIRKNPSTKINTSKDTKPGKSGFGDAFSAARKGGKRTFKFGGKSFTTRQKGESKQAFEAKFKKPSSVAKPKASIKSTLKVKKNGGKKVGVKFPFGRKV